MSALLDFNFLVILNLFVDHPDGLQAAHSGHAMGQARALAPLSW